MVTENFIFALRIWNC